jgi:uncharacterized protein
MTTTPLPSQGLYVGEVMHHRLRPFRHRFVYRVFTLLLDIDRLEETAADLRLLAIDRAGLLAFYRKDHGARDGGGLRPWVEAILRAGGIEPPGGPILLLAMPRVLGYVFNPLSIYFCYRPDGRLAALVHEVKNTFGGQHPYALSVDPGSDPAQIRQSCDKGFYVSPFIPMRAGYRFRLRAPDERLMVAIQETTDEGPLLVATLTGERRPLGDRALAGAVLRLPLMTFKVLAAIHLQALKLWWKGARYHPKPHAGTSG